MKLKILTNLWSPFSEMNEDGQFIGIAIDLLKHVAKDLNFTYDLFLPRDGKWGSVSSNGTWNGMIRDLLDKQADASFAPFTVVKSRAEAVDFTTSYYFFRPAISYKNHLTDSKTARKLLFLKPFSSLLWVLLGLVTLLVGFVLRFFERPANKFIYSVEHLFIFGSLINQGGSITVNRGASRLFLSAWWVFVITIVATYSGNIIANLAIRRVSYPFNSLEELAENNEYRLVLLEGAAYELIFKESNSTIYKKLWKQLQEDAKETPDMFTSDYDALTRLVKKVCC
ncbi:DgyrCDS12880 [Dimorphilus gyrociliatus]|uniref:DgyrCDS12880 n=1 Tax=Dimorphilus gyrociliatus TaxID=2664684 RepID=A0A7I8W916_9ANNE|nr:DgyrCDS12880 [Dimorphilus gyrociliatus]